MENETTVKWLGGISAVVGLWLVLAPFILGFSTTTSYWNELIVGVIAIVLGLTQLASPRTSWPSWINLVAAVWLIISPYAFNPPEAGAYTNAVVSGLVLGIVSLAGALLATNTMPMPTTHERTM